MNYLKNLSINPYFNMAFDEYCLTRRPFDEPFFYIWRNRPSVIVGVNQDVYSEVNLKYLKDRGIALVRRVTGGGAVYHDLQNVNYSIVRGLGTACCEDSASVEEFYSPSVEIFASALRRLGIKAELSGRNDIFVEGLKISGYARRIHKNAELVHGTLMYNVDIETLTNSLDTPESKLHRKGVASVRSRVGNIKDLLSENSSDIYSVEELMDRLYLELAKSSDSIGKELHLSEEQIAEIKDLAVTKFESREWIYR